MGLIAPDVETRARLRVRHSAPRTWKLMAPENLPGQKPQKRKAIAALLIDSLRVAAGAGRRSAVFPQLFPIPEPGRHLHGQREAELMPEHAHLPAMVGFVRKHIAQHFRANRPRPSPAISEKLLDGALAAKRFREHLQAASGALRQSVAGWPRRAVRAVELLRNLQVRSRKPDPLGADIVPE